MRCRRWPFRVTKRAPTIASRDADAAIGIICDVESKLPPTLARRGAFNLEEAIEELLAKGTSSLEISITLLSTRRYQSGLRHLSASLPRDIFPKNSRRHTAYQHLFRNVPCNNCTRSHNGPFSYIYAFQYYGIEANPHIISYY